MWEFIARTNGNTNPTKGSTTKEGVLQHIGYKMLRLMKDNIDEMRLVPGQPYTVSFVILTQAEDSDGRVPVTVEMYVENSGANDANYSAVPTVAESAAS